MKLDERKFLVLQAIIDDYIMTAVPVGSRTISRKAGMTFSPATIRNEMSDLEDLGYLDQPHTSAGRVPSAKAYRLYVDHLMKVGELDELERNLIKSHLDRRASQLEQVVRHAAQAMSEITQYAAVIALPESRESLITRVQLVPLSDATALMVVVVGEQVVKDSVIRIPEGIEPDHLYAISKMLTEQLRGVPLSEVRSRVIDIFSGLTEHRALMAEVINTLELEIEEEGDAPLVIGGSTNLLNHPEFNDVGKAKQFLSVLESRDKLYPLLKKTGGLEFTIRIGPENEIPEFNETSVVTATYRMGRSMKGTLGIIGPTRMDYARVVSVLNYMGQLVSDILSGE